MKILAVDDSPINLDLIRDIGDSQGYDVIPAMDGKSALQIAASEMPDLIILDVTMPGMSGFEVCSRLKSNPETSHIPVIMLTALGDIANRVEGLSSGADDYLTKPFSARELLARIETRLRAKTESDSLRETRKHIQDTFARFVSPSVVEKLLKDPARVKLGGQLQPITVMFADLQNFTTISETTPPEELLNVLNAHHELVVGLIQDHGGTIDKFVGDAVMALYNTPLEQEDHVMRAVMTAMAIQDALPRFHEQLPPEFQMEINIGLHTGLAVVGNVGAPHIMNFTAVGDTVNVAARLQSQGHNGQIIVSQSVYEVVKDYVQARLIGPTMLKGRAEAITVYEIL